MRVRRGVPGELFTVLFAIAPGTQRYTDGPTRERNSSERRARASEQASEGASERVSERASGVSTLLAPPASDGASEPASE